MPSPSAQSAAIRATDGVSIVLPCYNRGAYLAHWLAAFAWWQPYAVRTEILVVDDGGADHAAAIVERWRERGLDVRYLRLRAPGGPRNNAQARNAGIRAARFPLVLNSDPDVVFATDVVRCLVDAWRPATFCSVSGYFPLARQASMDLWRCHEQRPLEPADYQARAAGRHNLVHRPDGVYGLHGAFLCDRATLVDLRGYDERFRHWGWEDRDLLTRLEQGLGFVRQYVQGAVVVHQWHPSLRADNGPERSRALWQMGWQQACATTLTSVERNPGGWGEARSQGPAPAWADQARSVREAIDWQQGFEAYLHEARVWRREGEPRTAIERLRVALSRWWESGDGEASDTRPVDLQIALARAAGYGRVDDLSIEYAMAASDAGDRSTAALALDATAGQPGTLVAVANIRARWLVEDDRVEGAARLLEQTLCAGPTWTAASAEATARLVEALLRLDRRDEARAWVERGLTAASASPGLDVFDALLLDGYRVRLHGGESDRAQWPPRIATASAGEFLFSVAVRAHRAGLFFGAIAMFDAYLALDAGAEDELCVRARRLLDDARQAWAERSAVRRAARPAAGDTGSEPR